ncbi:MAG: S8 family serine peptidase [Candidatus Cloacimonetes bacterium]|nr:S8 family serine peptidase [Candidatus Cloacimonadota bacterium]
MKQIVGLMLICFIVIGLWANQNFTFNAANSYEKTIVVCFDRDVVGNREGIINVDITDGVVHTGISAFDAMAQKHRFVDMKQTVDFIQDLDWNDNGMYPSCIYRISLESNDNIEIALREMMEQDYILFAEYDPIQRIDYIPNDPNFSQQWHLPKISAPLAWDWTTGDDDVIIGIVDSGIMWNHPDLMDNIWVNEPELNSISGGTPMTINWSNGTVSGGNGIDDDGNGKTDDCIGWNFYNPQSNQSYQSNASNDHGTHVAGCAGAVGDNSIGVSGSSMHVKLISSRHAPTSQASPYIQNGNNGIYYCAQSGADVINCSWGGTGGSSQANLAINFAVDHGAVVICAAGNDGTNNGTTHHYPSDATNAVAVAATDQSDVKANFSNYGEPIDIASPGVSILSTIIAAPGYGGMQGTSMASPVAAGVAALVKATHPDMLPLEIKARLEESADNIDAVNPDYIGMLGGGRINAYRAAMYDLIPDLNIETVVLEELSGDGDNVPNPGEEIGISMELKNSDFDGGTWLTATGISVMLSCDIPEVEILSNTITFSDIPGGAQLWNTSVPFKFQIPANSSLQTIPFTATIYANLGNPWPYIIDKEFTVEVGLVQAGWPLAVGGASTSAAVIVDMLDNGVQETVFADNSGKVHAVMSDGTEAPGFPVDLASPINGAVAVANFAGNPGREIVATTEGNHIVAIANDGSIIFDHDAGDIIKTNPIIADVDGNGTNEIIAVTMTGNKVIVLNADGTDFAGFPAIMDAGFLASPAVADLDGDGNKEILCNTMTGQLHAVSSATATDITGFPVALGAGAWKGPIVDNMDADDEPEIVIANLFGKMMIFNHDASLAMEHQVTGQIKGSPVTYDFDGNGTKDIAFTTMAGDLQVIDTAGNNLPNFPVNIASGSEATPVLGDIDNNGTVDIVVGDNDGYLHAIDITGAEVANFPIFFGGESNLTTSAALGYADDDDDLEIVIPNATSFYMIDIKHSAGQLPWKCFKGNTSRTGDASQAYTPSGNTVTPVVTNELVGNYPNPFNPTTTILYNMQQEGPVTVDIFNIKGQKVKTLVNQHQDAGTHYAVWNGNDDNGNNVGSGIYFYKMRAGKYTSTKKMILMK